MGFPVGCETILCRSGALQISENEWGREQRFQNPQTSARGLIDDMLKTYKLLGGFEERHGPVCAYRRNKGTFYSELLTFHISEALEALSKKRLIEVFRRKTNCIVH